MRPDPHYRLHIEPERRSAPAISAQTYHRGTGLLYIQMLECRGPSYSDVGRDLQYVKKRESGCIVPPH